MTNELLTRDNTHFSRPTAVEGRSATNSVNCSSDVELDVLVAAINCTTVLPEDVRALVNDSLASSTRRAYLSDLRHFAQWGGSVPSTDRAVAAYLAAHSETLSPATLVRRLASIAKAHAAQGLASPTSSAVVKATLRGIKRRHGTAQAQATPLLREDLVEVLTRLGHDIRSVRDRALLLLGFAGAFRRSELVGLDVTDLEHVRQGLVVHLRRSKTDQLGAGRRIAIPYGRTRHCPIQALEGWILRAPITSGPLFRPVDRHGRVRDQRLSGEAVSLVVKEHASAAGLAAGCYSGHSLRAGLVTSAAIAGASSWKIRNQTGHASDAMLCRYLRDNDLFSDNAAARLL